MREAVGGAMLFYIVIAFLIIYIVFIGFIMNYASAYRAANYVVTQIENCQAEMSKCGGNDFSRISETIKNKYKYMGNIERCCLDNSRSGSVYRVSLNVEFELPMLGKFSPFKVKAETKTIGVSCSERSTDFPSC